MKTKLTTLLWASLIFLSFSCSDDNDAEIQPEPEVELNNEYIYDGDKHRIGTTMFIDIQLNNGIYEMTFGGHEDGVSASVYLFLSKKWDGKNVDLTKIDNEDVARPWNITYSRGTGTEKVNIVKGSGVDGQLGNIKSGTLYMKQVSSSPRKFDIKLDVTNTDGKRLRLAYNGQL